MAGQGGEAEKWKGREWVGRVRGKGTEALWECTRTWRR